jgi:hypothetical protein
MPEGLLVKYARARKISKSLVAYNRTGKTKEEREGKPIEDDRAGFLILYVTSTDTSYTPALPLSGSVREDFKVKDGVVVYRLIHKAPTRLFYFDVEVGKTILESGYGIELAKTQLSSAGVSDEDIDVVINSMSDDTLPAYFNTTLLVDILSSAGFTGFVYSSPFDKEAFLMWDGLSDTAISAYSVDGGTTWVDL